MRGFLNHLGLLGGTIAALFVVVILYILTQLASTLFYLSSNPMISTSSYLREIRSLSALECDADKHAKTTINCEAKLNGDYQETTAQLANLDAQEGIWNASESLVKIGFLQLIVSLLGLGLIGLTLESTFKTLSVSRIALKEAKRTTTAARLATDEAIKQTEIQRNSNRPFLMFEELELSEDPKTRTGGGIEFLSEVTFNYTAKNYGLSPARNVQCVGAGKTINEYEIGEAQFSQYKWEVNIGPHSVKINSIAPSGIYEGIETIVNFDDFSSDTRRNYKGNFFDGHPMPHQRALVFMRLRYEDIGGRRFYEDFCFEVCGSDYDDTRKFRLNQNIRPLTHVIEPYAADQGYPDYENI